MPGTLVPDRLLRRELGFRERSTKPRGIYGDTKWVRDLDIVNELDGHSGCVNALSWSKSGKLLASGSDDQHLNIHTYQPDHSDNPFALTTTVSTGHSANIFSVKFMPHSNDRTLVTCAGDAEIRVFDIEYAGRSNAGSNAPNIAPNRRAQGFLSNGVRYLSDADTNTRVYRSHSDRVKRIVTESSPFLFLSCSEDGEVRQWDLRQPSSAYPRPRSARAFPSSANEMGPAPPPLISYKPYDLDLNTISCSSSQPHYIALGGRHLHCFLHDRRMLGRDIVAEQGKATSSSSTSSRSDDVLSAATKCVKKFAPKAQQRMKKNDTGHITACKISDANPNEMIVSWSGDWVYNFDLLQSPDASSTSEVAESAQRLRKGKTRESRDRKRKREPGGSTISQEAQARAGSKARKSAEGDSSAEASVALRVRYENGQAEDIPVANESEEDTQDSPRMSNAPLSNGQRRRFRIAKTIVKIRKTLFSLQGGNEPSEHDPTGYGSLLSRTLSHTVSILGDMDEIMRKWRYPVNPEEFDTAYQNDLRHNRDRSRRFVQGCGALSRVLGGTLVDLSRIEKDAKLQNFYRVQSSSLERNLEDTSELFCFDFIKAICLWLESGVGALVEGFSSKNPQGPNSRRPLPENATIDDIDETLVPYLLRLASDRPIPNVDSSRFEVDSNRVLFNTEISAVLAFARAIKIPFADLSRAVVPLTASAGERNLPDAQDRRTALRFWGLKIARGVLMNASEGINFASVERAFGGLGKAPPGIRKEEKAMERQHEDIDSDESDALISSVGPVRVKSKRKSPEQSTGPSPEDGHTSLAHEPEDSSDEDMIPIDDVRSAFHDAEEGNAPAISISEPPAEDEGEDEDDASDPTVSEPSLNESSDDEADEDDDDEENAAPRNYLFRSAFARSSLRTKVNLDVPVVGPQLHYRGALNARTVKDVNFYGLNDEYVVSGSDSGHFFIWDRATGQLLNILEGDSEVVNVIQGHPYEPMLAVSGIDHTIKIFNADKRARENARRGVGVNNTGESGFSTLGMGGRTRFGRARRPPRRQEGDSEDDKKTKVESEPAAEASSTAGRNADGNASDTESEEAALAPSGLSSRRRMHLEYQITSQNDVERRGGNQGVSIPRHVLAQLAARAFFQRRHRGGGGEDEEGEEGNEDEHELLMGEDDEEGEAVIDFGGGRVLVNGGDCSMQ